MFRRTYPISNSSPRRSWAACHDRYSHKPILLISQVGTFIGFLMSVFAPGLFWFFISRAIDGVSSGNIATARRSSPTAWRKTRTGCSA